MSWVTAKYKDLSYQFKNQTITQDAPINEDNPNFQIYRQTRVRMISLQEHSTHWRASCNLTIGSCFSVHHRVMEHAGSLESTKEA